MQSAPHSWSARYYAQFAGAASLMAAGGDRMPLMGGHFPLPRWHRGQNRRQAPIGTAGAGAQVLRGGQETLLCIFDAFLHDPLVDWKNAAAARKTPQAVPGDDRRSALMPLLISRFRRLTTVYSCKPPCYDYEGKQSMCELVNSFDGSRSDSLSPQRGSVFIVKGCPEICSLIALQVNKLLIYGPSSQDYFPGLQTTGHRGFSRRMVVQCI